MSTVPDITDALGRVWTYRSGTRGLYVHDSMCWGRTAIERPDIAWPSPAILDNPNYAWCDTCHAHIGAVAP